MGKKLMKKITKTTYCSCCKTGSADVKHCLSETGVQYHYCNACNTEKCRKYRSTKKGKENIYKAVYKSAKKYAYKQSARVKVLWAVRQGKLIKPKNCSSCNVKTEVEGHHEDYNKPLEVIWLCRTCHSKIHYGKNKKGKLFTQSCA